MVSHVDHTEHDVQRALIEIEDPLFLLRSGLLQSGPNLRKIWGAVEHRKGTTPVNAGQGLGQPIDIGRPSETLILGRTPCLAAFPEGPALSRSYNYIMT